MNNLPRLDSLPTHPDKEKTSSEKELFYPSWKCFCCHDTGIINPHLTRLVAPKFDWNRDKLPLCTRCNKHNEKFNLLDHGIIDTRFNENICSELDKISREDWAATGRNQQQEIYQQKFEQAAIQIATEKSLRKRDRTTSENSTQHQKHEYIRENWDLEIQTRELKNECTN